MSFKSLIQDLRGVRISNTSNSQLSTKALLIDQISHPIDGEMKQLLYKYAEENDFIQKFKNIVVGEISNFTENKSVTHFKYKDSRSKHSYESFKGRNF